jgi:hypothetical protein
MTRAVCLLALFCLASVCAVDRHSENGGVSIDFVGVSGKIKIYPSSDATSFIMVAQSKLEELLQDGSSTSPKREMQMANADAGWDAPTLTTVAPGIVAYKTSFTQTAAVGANNAVFVLNATFYVNTTTLPSGLVVTQNSLKFDIAVSGWPSFTAASNYLSYELLVSAKGGDDGQASLHDQQTDVKRVRFNAMLNGGIDLPTKAIINGVADTDIVVNVEQKNNKDTIEFRFPGNNVVYDPVLTLTGHASHASILSYSLLALLIVLQVFRL